MIDEHFDFVARTLRKARVPASEVEDQVQRTFMVAAKRLDDVDLDAERGFLFQVALNVAAHLRRTLARRRELPGHPAPEGIEAFATPEHLTDRKRMRERLDRILDRMSEPLRLVFMLYAFEEMGVTEIARALRVPRGTVASRLRRAQEKFREHAFVITWCREGTA
jgi:RNA polymerase sigma-70 factor (ECF subfamily)